MKSIYKRFLLVGLSLSLIALAGLHSEKQPELEGGPGDGPDGEKLGPIPVPDPEPRAELPSPAPNFLSATRVTFSGKLVRNGSLYVLRETGGNLYTLTAIQHALPQPGEDVRVTGRLDFSRNLLQVDDIECFNDAAFYFPRASGQ